MRACCLLLELQPQRVQRVALPLPGLPTGIAGHAGALLGDRPFPAHCLSFSCLRCCDRFRVFLLRRGRRFHFNNETHGPSGQRPRQRDMLPLVYGDLSAEDKPRYDSPYATGQCRGKCRPVWVLSMFSTLYFHFALCRPARRDMSALRLPRRHGSASAAGYAWPSVYATSRHFAFSCRHRSALAARCARPDAYARSRLFASLGVTGARRPRGVPDPLRTPHLGFSPPSASRERVGREACLARCVCDISFFHLSWRHGFVSATRCAWPAAHATYRLFASVGGTGARRPRVVPGPLRTRLLGSSPPLASRERFGREWERFCYFYIFDLLRRATMVSFTRV